VLRCATVPLGFEARGGDVDELNGAGSVTPATAPPGWYPTLDGTRWWDGQAWGPLAPGAQPIDDVSQGKTLALISHLGVFVGGFILPLVIRLTEGKKNDYVKHHATESLNFNITLMIGWFAGFVILIVGAASTTPQDHNHSAPGWFLVAFVAFFAFWIAAVVFSILGAIRASQGVWWRYPVNIRFVRGAQQR
jgi:uncharacterized Tic20 family protein